MHPNNIEASRENDINKVIVIDRREKQHSQFIAIENLP